MEDVVSVEKIARYFPETDQSKLDRFTRLGSLYPEWNNKINVISRKDIDSLYEHHILHSLAIAKAVTFAPGAKVLDVGTGGGFPGIPLAIMFPETQFLLIDSIGKKLKVVDAIVDDLQLNNVKTQHVRAEQLKEQFDFVVSRAVTALPVFISWINQKFLKRSLHKIPNGVFCLKGGNIGDEIQPFRAEATVIDINDFFKEPYFGEKKIVYIPMV